MYTHTSRQGRSREDEGQGTGTALGEADIACLLVPDYLVALARRARPDLRNTPVVVGGAPAEHAEVRACSREAAAAGVLPGMTLRRALALCRDAVFLPFKESEATEEAQRVVTFLSDHSPVVEAIEPGHAHFDIRGLAGLARMDERSYLEDLAMAVEGLTGLPVSFGAAGTVFAAHAAALGGAAQCGGGAEDDGGTPRILIVHEEVRFLASLPVEVLPVAPAMHQRLRLLGLERLEQIAGLPFASLQAQFGTDGVRAWRLARGDDDSVLNPRSEDLQVRVEMDLPAPAVTSEPLVVATRALLQRALAQQDVQGRSIRSVGWRLSLESGESVKRRAAFREPTRDIARMMFILQGKIERLELASAGIAAAVVLSGLCSEYAHQGNLWGTGPKRRQELQDSIEQLNASAGGPQVFQIVEVQPWSRIPERQLALAPYDP